MQAEEIWFGDSFAARASRMALLPAAGLYGLGFAVYRGMYDFGIKRSFQASLPVICVGNLAVGGSGKTPTTLHIADVLKGLGRDVVVSASGYGSPGAEAAAIAPEGPLDPREWGDEPAMMRWLRPDLKLVVGRRRPLAARLIAEAFPKAILLMDDGFQHLPLAKTLTILLDPEKPPNPFPLPAGPYREFRSARRRADLVLETSTVATSKGFVQSAMPSEGPFRLSFTPLEVRSPEGELIAISPGDETNLITAIARPERLMDGVRELGVFPATDRTLPDHDPLDAPDLLRGFEPTQLIFTTPKDWVKLSLRPDAGEFRWGIVHRSVRIDPHEPFVAWLRDRIGED